MIARAAAVLLLALAGCRTVEQGLGLPGGRVLRAELGATGTGPVLWRWTPTDDAAPRVFVVPELGFDHRLVSPLCEALRATGYDVATLDGRTDPEAGLAAWHGDVARALTQFGPARVLAIGLGGRAAFEVAEAQPSLVRGIVAVNVPLARSAPNLALAEALLADGFAPHAWSKRASGSLLLARGRQTPQPVTESLAMLSVPLAPRLANELARWLAVDLPAARAIGPVHAFAGVKDNLVQPEQALVAAPDAPRVASARRLGRIEFFRRDYGHLDWLVERDALADVLPTLGAALEALP